MEWIGWDKAKLRFMCLLGLLIACALLLSGRLIYLFLADAHRFPINTVKIVATYQHITRKQLEEVLTKYLNASFFSLPVKQLHTDLSTLAWTKQVSVVRIWPDTLKITLTEKTPVAIWNDSFLTNDGELFQHEFDQNSVELPRLSGPENQQRDVLQIYQKLSKILSKYGLRATSLQLSNNQAWELSLENGVQLRLGKRDMERRLQRFCSAYPALFADKPEQLSSVDLRYARGMAVQWKQQTGR
ncbi:cell division protein FtsQ/DivIB [Legionella oakridgensis]|uniref:Cell division protein FtsQ n=2 Tax=Legionella oakridgensis TaxID=29423 RepID=W0B6H8_9GAMM|nr:cell division protein FtsQ/DivIB [Legionella oakridgensis]AHE66148.1 cell division septal protein [Legionella oakridgensis ATCC 33761 = DSM 21215]ETO94013.1 cell division septal protein [Legionella oakridgensis RV-2-2007]KTD43891.1 cell division protein FtsQ [Legionella oakridgensis]STY16059.1 cell division protein FtsQ [Legionella longbeachae]